MSGLGARVLIFGGGGCIGLYAIEMARAAGAVAVDYVDKPDRLAAAEALGARTIPRGAPVEPAPVVLDASSHPAELARALRAVAPGGICHSVGIYFLDTPLPLLDMYGNDVTFRTGRPSVGPHIARVLELVAAGAVHPERVSSGEVPWDAAVEVLLERAVKPILTRARASA